MESYQNARASHSNVVIDDITVLPPVPVTFGKLQAILVQEHILVGVAGPRTSICREGDGIVARGKAGEDARIKVEDATSATRAIRIVEVGEEGVKRHCLGRFEFISPPGGDENDRKVAKRWFLQRVVRKVGNYFFSQRLFHLFLQFGH